MNILSCDAVGEHRPVSCYHGFIRASGTKSEGNDIATTAREEKDWGEGGKSIGEVDEKLKGKFIF